jgi:hypothetical protein
MKRATAIHLEFRLVSVACLIVLAGSLRSIRAADPTSLSRIAGVTPTPTRSFEPAKSKFSPLTRLRAAPVAASATKQGGAPPPLAVQVAREGSMITSLQARLDRQEKLLALQQQQITQLVATLDDLKKSLRGTRKVSLEMASESPSAPVAAHYAEVAFGRTTDTVANPPAGQTAGGETFDPSLLASLQAPVFPRPAGLDPSAGLDPTTSSAQSSPIPPPSAQDQTQPYTTRLETLSQQVEGISKGIAGFRFSGDFRVRGDCIFRSSNAIAGPEQDVRARYRARLNFDKGIDPQLDAHFQLGSGTFENPLTDNTDFGGGIVKGPIFLSEAWVNYHPNSNLSFQAGKMPEVFSDFTRFMWSNNARFDGFQESVGTSPGDNSLGITRLSLRAGQYILTNPNIQVLPTAAQCASASPPAACIYLQAGYAPGENVRSADLFDEGLFVDGRIKPGWSHYLFGNFLSYRNANQIALGSTSSGFTLLANNELGLDISGPLPGTGTATTLPGGGIFSASHFQIGHLSYRITKEGMRFHSEEFPVFMDVQASRNFGTSFLRNAWMVTLNAGQIRKAGDVRFLYFYSVKDANSIVSEFTDSQLGTNTGVNVRTHSFRFDVGLARFLQWQNILYIQNEISPNDPARHFYVPVPQGAGTQFRVQSSLFVNF